MLSYDDALALLGAHALHPDIVRHCVGAAEFARGLATRISERHPALPLDVERVRVTTLLHDIGRTRPGIHEYNSVEILREEGHPDLADIVLHGTLYETFQLQGRTDPSLLPQTLEQKIVCYADLRFGQRPMTLRERLDDAHARKGHNEGDARTLRLAEKRLAALEAELLALAGVEE
jgi:putative nucleotidyltransferase with HDIG domain